MCLMQELYERENSEDKQEEGTRKTLGREQDRGQPSEVLVSMRCMWLMCDGYMNESIFNRPCQKILSPINSPSWKWIFFFFLTPEKRFYRRRTEKNNSKSGNKTKKPWARKAKVQHEKLQDRGKGEKNKTRKKQRAKQSSKREVRRRGKARRGDGEEQRTQRKMWRNYQPIGKQTASTPKFDWKKEIVRKQHHRHTPIHFDAGRHPQTIE